MKILVVFVLAVLGCCLAEGRLVKKCELRNQLLKAVGNLTAQAKPNELNKLVATFVCHAERASGFNTSKVNEPEMNFQFMKRRNIKNLVPTLVRRSAQDDDIATLYGIFQLSNRLACSDGMTPSPTICGLDCTELVDDDIRDDISCLLQVFSSLSIGLVQEECTKVQPFVYFAKCRKP
ncbi:alpha-lactalbumin-like [Channa argus]|uniref:alpha-lactalbumin-like n=1 Tax=Channa argus TaxID=215402 RepID=UPI00294558D2|nr:hypothetical protein Q8A73_002879 [Channa argus]